MDNAAQDQSVISPKPKGRPFVKGDPRICRTGRPKGSVSLKAACMRIYSRSDVERVARRLLDLATEGDIKAVRLLSEMLGDSSTDFRATIQNNLAILPSDAQVIFNIPSNNRPMTIPATVDVDPIPSNGS